MGVKCVTSQRERGREGKDAVNVKHYLNPDTCTKYYMTCSFDTNYGSDRRD